MSSAAMSTDKELPTSGNPKKGKQEAIRTELQRAYNAVLDEPLPDAFADLLKQLDEEPPAAAQDEGSQS